MTRLAEPERDWEIDADREAAADPELDVDLEPDTETELDIETEPDTETEPNAGRGAIADRIRDRGEHVRRRELETALGKLQATGEVTPAERRVVAALSAQIADALVERWASKLTESEVDPEAAFALLSEWGKSSE